MTKFLSKHDAEKIYNLFLLFLPEYIVVEYSRNLMFRRYEFYFATVINHTVYSCGFYFNSKKDFEKNSWYIMNYVNEFKNKIADKIKEFENDTKNI